MSISDAAALEPEPYPESGIPEAPLTAEVAKTGMGSADPAVPGDAFGLALHKGFTGLPEPFFTRLAPTPLTDPYLVALSEPAAALLGLDPGQLRTSAGLQVFAGNRPLPGGAAHAAVYSGHQFGVWAGQLGDGRAITLGEAHHGATRWEIQLKGAGPTPYSRMGDGRAVLRSSIREFLCSEAMAALGIPTTRALCVVGSEDPVIRETIETAAVVTRLAASFVRFGSFEHWAHRDRLDELRRLADFMIDNYFPDIGPGADRYRHLLGEVTARTARLIADWQSVGFCHGVMNTDNMSLLGLTLDYGPFGFMEAFDAGHICNHSDTAGRYAYGRQPQVAHWNLYALGQALLPLIGSVDDTRSILEGYRALYDAAIQEKLRAKLGLVTAMDTDGALIDALFVLLQANHPDFTQFFRHLSGLRCDAPDSDAPIRDLFLDRAAFDAWAIAYRARLAQEQSSDPARQLAMRAVNPKFVLRNYLAEQAIQQARQHDYSEVERLLRVLERPFEEQPENAHYAALPPQWAAHLEVSCSS